MRLPRNGKSFRAMTTHDFFHFEGVGQLKQFQPIKPKKIRTKNQKLKTAFAVEMNEK
jgi:hypothetical protein